MYKYNCGAQPRGSISFSTELFYGSNLLIETPEVSRPWRLKFIKNKIYEFKSQWKLSIKII